MVMAVGAQEVHIPLNDGWSFCQVGKEQWRSAEVPGVVQTDLLRHGLIPDFYQGSNIDSVQWIENEDWIYKRTIVANDTLLEHGHLDLVFKGLDTFAEVYLNDSLLGKADNMFRTWEWPVKNALKPGANELKVIFRSPIKEGAKLRDAYGVQLPHDNDPTGVSPYIRKAAYQFGWDFCPRLVTSGIWQEVELRGWSMARIRSVHVDFDGSQLDRGKGIQVRPLCDLDPGVSALVKVDLDGEPGYILPYAVFADRTISVMLSDQAMGVVQAKEVSRWWPRGMGAQNMHHLSVELFVDGKVVSHWSSMEGFRDVELDQQRDRIGSSFTFRVNGEEVFMRGCNLVPPSLIPVIRGDVWMRLVKEMQRAGMNMVRVWAGGVYPPDEFFLACDTAGIMVWQDAMVANLHAEETSYLTSLEFEVGEQFGRIKHHPSTIHFCGNNEVHVAWMNWGWQSTYGLHGSDSARVWERFDLMSRLIGIFAKQGASHTYTHTSPLSNWGNAEGLRSGDLHYWGVWHGDSAFSSFANNVGRFVSEYGFQSYPDSALLAKYNDPKDLYLGSPTMKRLQRSYKTDKPIWDAIKRELGKEPKTFGGFVEASQEVQAKAYRMAIEAHMAAQPHCMGTLFWQLNDCWPGPSWSLIDFEGNWKPGMYEVQRLFQR